MVLVVLTKICPTIFNFYSRFYIFSSLHLYFYVSPQTVPIGFNSARNMTVAGVRKIAAVIVSPRRAVPLRQLSLLLSVRNAQVDS